MKHIIPTIALIALASSASAQVASKKNALSYDRVALTYASNDYVDGLSISTSADVGGGVIIGGSFTDISIDDFDADGRGVSASIGFAQPVGAGSVYVGISYQQLWAAGYSGAGALEGTGYTLTYRHAVSSLIELGAGIVHFKYTGGITDGFSVWGGDDSDTQWGVNARFNLTKEFNVSLGYIFADEDTWSLSVGYEF
jgi:hypothetical protein